MCDVSVLTPSYGYGRFIRDAILSVLQQQGTKTEHIIQDAESQDATVAVLEEFGTRLKWCSEPDAGQSDALNKALALARGRWVGWLNADEFYLPGALERLVEEGDRTGADVVYGDAVFVDGNGRLLRTVPQHSFSPAVLRRYGVFIPSNSTIFRRSKLQETSWDVELKLVMDWDLYLKLLDAGAVFRHLCRPVGGFRVHANRVSAGSRREFSNDYAIVRQRHQVTASRWRLAGRLLHATNKLISGAYARQLRARELAGIDLRWFSPETDPEVWEHFLRRCYS